jgi:uncharacterized RDD family membrane protein YckC
MNCPKCVEVCSCPMEPLATAVPAESPISPVASPESIILPITHCSDSPSVWRDELASHLNRYRARRKAPPPRYPSLRLPFERSGAIRGTFSRPEEPDATALEPISNCALALDGMQQLPSRPESTCQEPPALEVASGPGLRSGAPPSAKIIEFPRFAWAPPAPPPDQLAEPVMDRPRILEVPEFVPPPPALGGITIEPVEVEEPAKRPGIDMPLQAAPLGLRIVAALADGLIISLAAALFGLVFWKVAEIGPPKLQVLGISGAILFVFWAAFQYLLIVYSARTPGLALAGLELVRFDGLPAKRSLRRWRVLASFLSAVSLGMGYVWVFLDEDSLCWHDRITRTYLAPRKLDMKEKRES